MVGLDAAEAERILTIPVASLALQLRRGTLKAVDVLSVFKARIIKINDACNAVMDWSPYAEEEAKRADEYQQRTGLVLGPLHGVPCTVKDHVMCKGTRVTANMRTLGKLPPHESDEDLSATLRSLGAIIIAKSTMTQLGMTWGSGGPLQGDTLNPWDTLRSPAGSSCGEGALIGGGASPFGIGSDIGGSLRLPSAMCGICTLKPTVGRMDLCLTHPGAYFPVPATTGVMAKTVDDLCTVYSALFAGEALSKRQPRLVPIPFNHAEFSSVRPLRIAYYMDILSYPAPCPTARRAVEEAVVGLKGRGHEVFLFEPKTEDVNLADIWGCDSSFDMSNIPLQKISEIADRTPFDATVYNKLLTSMKEEFASTGKLRQYLLPSWAPNETAHPDYVGQLLTQLPPTIKNIVHIGHTSDGSCNSYKELVGRRDQLRSSFYSAIKNADIDVLLCPTVPFPAVYVEDYRHVAVSNVGCRVFNFMDMPAGHVTTTSVTKEDIAQPWDLKSVDENLCQAAKRSFETAEGLPMGVQVAALPFKEELCLRAMREVALVTSFPGGHASLSPVPRRTPSLGDRPVETALKSRL